jgi:hypothetical protein
MSLHVLLGSGDSMAEHDLEHDLWHARQYFVGV